MIDFFEEEQSTTKSTDSDFHTNNISFFIRRLIGYYAKASIKML